MMSFAVDCTGWVQSKARAWSNGSQFSKTERSPRNCNIATMSHRTHIVFDDKGIAWKSKVDARVIDLNVQPAEEEGYYSAAEWPVQGQLVPQMATTIVTSAWTSTVESDTRKMIPP